MTSELDPQARELIGLAMQGERRLPRNREGVRRGVLAAVAAPAALGLSDAALAAGKAASAAGSASAGTKVTLLGAATWLKAAPLVLAGAVAGVAGMVGLQQLRSSESAPALAASQAAASPRAGTPVPPAVEVPPGEPLLVEPPPVEAAQASQTPPKANRASTAPAGPAVGAPPPSLAAELEALQRAQRALNAGNAALALNELRAVRGQALRAERVALEVFAHCALGNVAQARQQAVLFRQLAPQSPLLPRVNASCAGD